MIIQIELGLGCPHMNKGLFRKLWLIIDFSLFPLSPMCSNSCVLSKNLAISESIHLNNGIKYNVIKFYRAPVGSKRI